MNGFSLRRNLVFDWNIVAYRIDRLLPNGAVLIERIEDGELQLVQRDVLLQEFSAGRISTERCGDPSAKTRVHTRPSADISENERDEMRRRLTYLQALVEAGGPVFTPEFTRPIVKETAEQLGDDKPPSAATLYRWHCHYRQSNDPTALIPRFDRRGSRAMRQHDRVIELAEQSMEEAFHASPKAGAKDVFVLLKGKIQDENGKRFADEQLLVPSLRTVHRLMQRVDMYDLGVFREGKVQAAKRYRINKRGATASNILERVEVDHTPLDLFLICERSFLPLGRPTLTLFLDRFSRMPIGYHLSFGGPSAAAVMGGLRHAILPKIPLEPVFDALRIDHKWPCHGVMDFLVLDNGLEFHGKDLESVALDIGFRLQFCPKHAPHFKGAIERFFKTLNHFFVHQLPGTSMARLQERGDYDPAKHAVLTLAQFKYVLEKWLLDVYAQTVHRGIGVTPWAKWQQGEKGRITKMPPSRQALDRRIGLVAERSLRRDGLWLNNIRYSGEALGPVLCKFGQGCRVRVLYNHEDLGEVQVWAPDSDEPISVQAVDYDYAKGLTSYQHELICAKLREEGTATENRHARDRAKYELAQSIQALMASRKQGRRRQAAALSGLTSTNPSRGVEAPRGPKQEPKRVKRVVEQQSKESPPVLPSFRIPRKGGQHG